MRTTSPLPTFTSFLLACALLAVPATVQAASQDANGGESVAVDRALAVLVPTAGHAGISGIVHLTESAGTVKVVAEIHGLEPGSIHGFHIHEYGDISAEDGTSAGGHYAPRGHDHALPEAKQRHAGDLGSVTADDQGIATYEISSADISIAGGKRPVLGRAIVLHAQPDDGGQPTGNAGARIAVGVIGIDGPEG